MRKVIAGILAVVFGLLIFVTFVTAPPVFTNQYNQSGTPYIAYGGAPSGNYNDLNVSGEGLTYDIPEAQDGTQFAVAYYNFTDRTNNKAYSKVTDNVATPLPWANGWDGTEATAAQYANLAASDNARASAVSGAKNREPWWRFNFTINQSIADIQWIYVEMELRTTANAAGENCTFTIANFSASAWQRYAPDDTPGGGDTWRTRNFTGGFNDIISPTNQLVLLTNGINLDNGEACSVDFVQVRVGYNVPLYRAEIWHNSTPVNYTGTLGSVNATIRFNSTVNASYNLSIYNWALGAWNSTPCQGVNAAANTYYQLWCNATQSPASYISPNNATRISINSTPHAVNGTLIEDYVQFYVSYSDTTPPRWNNSGSNTTSPAEGEAVLLFAQGFDETLLEYAVLETNESGAWENKTSAYGSPLYLGTINTWTWSNFSWQNTSVTAGTQVSWRIWYNDSSGNLNSTNIMSFTIAGKIIDITLYNAPILFPNLNPGSVDQQANSGNGFPLVVKIESTTNVITNLSVKAGDFTSGVYSFGAGNMSYSNSSTGQKTNATNNYPSSPPYSDWMNMPKASSVGAFNRSIYFWISIPSGQPAGDYTSNVTVNVYSN